MEEAEKPNDKEKRDKLLADNLRGLCEGFELASLTSARLKGDRDVERFLMMIFSDRNDQTGKKIFETYFKNKLLQLKKRIFTRVSQKRTFEEKAIELNREVRKIMDEINLPTFLDCVRSEFSRPVNENFFFQHENISKVSENLFDLLERRHLENIKAVVEYTQEIADKEPEEYIPKQIYNDNRGRAKELIVYKLTTPEFLAENGVKTGNCIADENQGYHQDIVTRPGEQRPRIIILTVEEVLDTPKTVGFLFNRELKANLDMNTAGLDDILEEKYPSNYEQILTSRWPKLTIELRILNSKKKSPGKIFCNIAQAELFLNEDMSHGDGFSLDIFVKQILPKIMEKLDKDGYEIKEIKDNPFSTLSPKNKFLTSNGREIEYLEAGKLEKNEMIIAGGYMEVHEDIEWKDLEKLLRIKDMYLDMNAVVKRPNLLAKIKRSEAHLSFRGLDEAQEIILPNLEYVRNLNMVTGKYFLPSLKEVKEKLECGFDHLEVPKLKKVGDIKFNQASGVFPELEEITGTFSSTISSAVKMPNLKIIHEGLFFAQSMNLDLPNLEHIGGDLSISHSSNVNLPIVKSIDGAISMGEARECIIGVEKTNHEMLIDYSCMIAFPNLKIAKGDITIDKGSRTIDMPSLIEASGNISIFENSYDIYLNSLKNIGLSLFLKHSKNLNFHSLETVKAVLAIGKCTTIDLKSLKYAGEIKLDEENVEVNIDLVSLKTKKI